MSELNQQNKKRKIAYRDYESVRSDITFGDDENLEINDQFEEYKLGLNHIVPKTLKTLSIDYMRGLFDSERGTININECSIKFSDTHLALFFKDNIGVKCTSELFSDAGEMVITFRDNNVIDFLGKIYPPTLIFCNNKKYTWYKNFIAFDSGNLGVFKVKKTDPEAVIPSKPNASDIGYDLTVIKKLKTKGDVTFYDTGLVIEPSVGYYSLLYPRSSISKTGYMLANSVGVIDPGYRSNFIVALRKVDKDAPDLELPCRIAQMVPQRCHFPDLVVVDHVDETTRGEGGFGSSN